MKKMNKTPLAAAMGAAFITTFSAGAVNAETNPFGMSELSGGYMQLAEAGQKAGEMACGANMNMPKTKGAEGACASMKKPAAEAKAADGKCGAGTCGSMMKDGKMKEGMEKMCGAMMKGKEGACGDSMKKTTDDGK